MFNHQAHQGHQERQEIRDETSLMFYLVCLVTLVVQRSAL